MDSLAKHVHEIALSETTLSQDAKTRNMKTAETVDNDAGQCKITAPQSIATSPDGQKIAQAKPEAVAIQPPTQEPSAGSSSPHRPGKRERESEESEIKTKRACTTCVRPLDGNNLPEPKEMASVSYARLEFDGNVNEQSMMYLEPLNLNVRGQVIEPMAYEIESEMEFIEQQNRVRNPSAIITPVTPLYQLSKRYTTPVSTTPIRLNTGDVLESIKNITTNMPGTFEDKCDLCFQCGKLREAAVLNSCIIAYENGTGANVEEAV